MPPPSREDQDSTILAFCRFLLRRGGKGEMRGDAAFLQPIAYSLQSPSLGLLAYVVVIAAVVWGSMAIHLALGPRTPFLVLGWMPYRLLNHVPSIVLVMVCGLLCTRAWGNAILAAAVVYGVLIPLVTPSSVLAHYLQPSVAVLFGLMGAAWGVGALDESGRRAPRMVMGVVPIVLLSVYHQWGAMCAAVGLVVGMAGARRMPGWRRDPLLWAPIAAAMIVLVVVQGMHRDHLPRSAFDVAVAQKLAEMGDAGAMLAGRPDEFTLQARTGHPVIVESATASLISYLPALGPAINAIFDDFYGIRFDRAPEDAGPGWEAVWKARSVPEWQRLAERYAVWYFVAPEHLDVNLELLLDQSGSRLYRVPRVEAEP